MDAPISARHVVVAVALAVTATLASCSEAPGDHGAGPRPPDVEFSPPAATSDDARPVEVAGLPLTALLVRTEELDRARHLAIERAKASCMEARGFHHPTTPYVPLPAELSVDRPFGPWTVDEIDAFGYGGPHQEVVDPVADYTATLSTAEAAAWEEALLGGVTRSTEHIEAELVDGTTVNVGLREETRSGCNYQAVSDVLGDLALYEAYRQTLQGWHSDAFARTEASAVVQQALRAWRACMDRAGYGGIDGPLALIERFTAEPGVSDEERRAGRADVACKESSDLHDAWFATKQHEEQEILDQHPEVVAEWQRMLDGVRSRVQ